MRSRHAVHLGQVLLIALGLSPLNGQSPAAPTTQQQIGEHTRQAQQFLKDDKPGLAIPELRAVIALDPANLDAAGNLGVLLFFQRDYPEAIPYLRAALKLQPTPWKIEALLGISEKRTNHTKDARMDLETALPHLLSEQIHVQAGLELIELYTQANSMEAAARTAAALREAYPTNVDVLYAHYRIYSDLAGESMLQLSLVAPDSARMHQVMAHEMARQGNTEKAIENYRAALALSPEMPGLRFELAEALHASSDATVRAQAENEYRAALAANPFDQQSNRKLGEISTEKGDLSAARKFYARAVELRPDDAEAIMGEAKVLIALHEPQQAQMRLERALQLDPTMATAHYRLSFLYRNAGRSADAQHEMDAFRKYKQMKQKLEENYRAMRIQTAHVKAEPEEDPR